MAEIKLAKTAGFCWGVKKAIDITLDAAKGKPGPIYTYGPLIHNPQLIKLLESKNIHVKNDINGMEGGEIIIRTHGITPQKRQSLKEKGIEIRDATCPLVAKVQGLIKKFSRKGYSIIIVGDEDHAEVIGLKGYAETPVHVIASPAEAESLPDYDKVMVCAQTTCEIENYQNSIKYLRTKYRNLEVAETVCDATNDRQSEVIELAREVDAMVVVGGKNSANTARLASIARDHGLPTWHIETESELDLEQLSGYARIGVTAGASTPKWVIEDVVHKLSSIQPSLSSRFPRVAGGIEFIVKSEIFLSLGLALTTFVNMKVMGLSPSLSLMALAFCGILSTYLSNRILRKDELNKGKMGKYRYHIKYNRIFQMIAGLSAVAGGFLAFRHGFQILGIYAAILLFGSTYGTHFTNMRVISMISKLKSIPASKDLFVGLAWILLTVVIPYIAYPGARSFAFPLLFTFGFAYVRTVLLDLRDVYSDQIMGREAAPILIGKEKATYTMYGVLVILSLIILSILSRSDNPGIYVGYLSAIIYLLSFIYYNQNNTLIQSTKFEFFLDMHCFIMGLLVFII